MSMSHVYTCKTCSTRATVIVHPNGEACPQLASRWYDLIEEKVEPNPNKGPGVKDEWISYTVTKATNEQIEAKIAELQSR